MATDPKKLPLIEKEIDADPYYSALYEAESGRNPNAKNPESSAAGGFQFVKATAKAMGLEDPTDLGSSFDAVRKLTDTHRDKFGDDPALLYGAHYMGESLLRKVVNKGKLTEKEREIYESFKEKALPRFLKIYNKTNKATLA